MRKLNFFPIIIIVLLLTAAILVCYPLTDASDGPVYLLACSDFQAPEGHAAGAESVSEMLSVIKEGFPAMDGFICAGDYDYNFTDSLGGILRLRETVREAYGTQMDEIWLQGNHDDPGMIGSYCTPSGASDTASYGVYVINEADYMWYNDDEETIRQTAASLKAYLDEQNIPFRAIEFTLDDTPGSEEYVKLIDIYCEEIYEDGLVERVIEYNDIIHDHYEKLDAARNP